MAIEAATTEVLIKFISDAASVEKDFERIDRGLDKLEKGKGGLKEIGISTASIAGKLAVLAGAGIGIALAIKKWGTGADKTAEKLDKIQKTTAKLKVGTQAIVAEEKKREDLLQRMGKHADNIRNKWKAATSAIDRSPLGQSKWIEKRDQYLKEITKLRQIVLNPKTGPGSMDYVRQFAAALKAEESLLEKTKKFNIQRKQMRHIDPATAGSIFTRDPTKRRPGAAAYPTSHDPRELPGVYRESLHRDPLVPRKGGRLGAYGILIKKRKARLQKAIRDLEAYYRSIEKAIQDGYIVPGRGVSSASWNESRSSFKSAIKDRLENLRRINVRKARPGLDRYNEFHQELASRDFIDNSRRVGKRGKPGYCLLYTSPSPRD